MTVPQEAFANPHMADVLSPGLSGGPTARTKAAADSSAPRVAILAGGLSHERDVSLRSGRRVAEALRIVGVPVTVHDVDSTLLPTLARSKPDVVWPLLHGAGGEDGSLRDILELEGLPYVGTGPRASRLAWDKPIAKERLCVADVTTPEWLTLPQELFRDLGAPAVLAAVTDHFGLPVFVKPTRGGSALGVSRVDSPDALPRAMIDCFAYCPHAMIERAVPGTEVAVSVFDGPEGPAALPAVEIVPAQGTYDYDARYNPGRVEYFTPARLTPEMAEVVTGLALRVHDVLELRDLSRTDMVISEDGVAHVLEVNVAPGMTETSLLPQAAESAGFYLPTLYRHIVEQAASRRL